MNSFAILRTNVGLTTNIKIMIDSNYNLSLDSIESTDLLQDDKYKKVKFNKNNFWDELIPYFYKNTPLDAAFAIKFDNDIDNMSNDFQNQYDEIYQYGARNIINNKSYLEEYEYFAPLYISKDKLPQKFIIFRVDGPGINLLTKDNFTSDISQRFKCVKVFDLSLKTPIGEWLNKNFVKNDFFPDTPLEIDFRELEFCRWNGIDYETGGYTSKSFFIDDIIDEEKEIFELERFIFDSYKNNKCVFPNILNLSFLFDDEPSTPDVKRKWSLNRYFGFYLDDLEYTTSISPYITPFLRSDVQIIDGNVLSSVTNVVPFTEGWSDSRPFYVEWKNNYYKVEKFTETVQNVLSPVSGGVTPINSDVPTVVNEQFQDQTITKYRIISEIDLKGRESELNKNYGRINEEGRLVNYENNYLQIEDFLDYSVWLIEIDGFYHNLFYDGISIKVSTDFSFEFNENDFMYKVSGNSKKISTLVDFNNSPKKFNIYRAKFTDIKDFDTRIVETEYAKFEYEKPNDLTYTDETKMYFLNLLSKSNPPQLDDFLFITEDEKQVVNIPVSSEYISNHEIFKITNNELSDIWRKNPVYCRWSFQNSISGNDYPYSLNNSSIFEDFNRTVNPFDPEPKRVERNLDYFYTLNSSTSSYLHHSLHIEKIDSDNNLEPNFEFELDKYLGLATYSIGSSSATYSFDYFTDFFYQKQKFLNGLINKNVKKYSEFNRGDISIPNMTLFRGLKFTIYDIDSIDISGANIKNINLKTSNQFNNYKFSILLSDNNKSVNDQGQIIDSTNTLSWKLISEWKMDTDYVTGSIVVFDDILYISNQYVKTSQPIKLSSGFQVKVGPYNLNEWDIYNPLGYNIFWSPNSTYVTGVGGSNPDIVYNSGVYYKYRPGGTEDFWNPITADTTGYGTGDVVFYRGKYYTSRNNNNRFPPGSKSVFNVNSFINSGINRPELRNWWSATQSSDPKWEPVELWSPTKNYINGQLVAHNEIVWRKLASLSGIGEQPGVSSQWIKKYSLLPDTDTVYDEYSNSIIEMNDTYYLCTGNSNSSTLDNGIIIYVNKKWKNILVNINISDNTYDNIKGFDRDSLYNERYKKLTAVNLSNAINDITSRYGFTDYVTYVLIDENGKITKHNYQNNLKSLSCLIKVENPDEFNIKIESLKKVGIEKPSKLTVVNKLTESYIDDLSKLNWYNEIAVGSEISENKFENKVFENFSGNQNFTKNQIWRHSGYYMPTFYDIQLFYKGIDDNSDNGKFDPDLTDFGLIKERKIRKVNRNGSNLKLRDQKEIKSIYPMLDEFGYTYRDFFIFCSTFDFQYYYENSQKNIIPEIIMTDPVINSSVVGKFGQPAEYVLVNKNYNL